MHPFETNQIDFWIISIQGYMESWWWNFILDLIKTLNSLNLCGLKLERIMYFPLILTFVLTMGRRPTRQCGKRVSRLAHIFPSEAQVQQLKAMFNNSRFGLLPRSAWWHGGSFCKEQAGGLGFEPRAPYFLRIIGHNTSVPAWRVMGPLCQHLRACGGFH